ncbi:MAG: hypothetical protein K2M55_09030 [Muribaculaceae bacterium]|nr:hypothetical protein [Muribaculaceae bacterium]
MPELIDRAMAARPQQFYLSYDTARRLLKTYYDHGHEAFLYAEKAAEVEELAAHVERAMARNRRMRLSEALTFVLHFCRPSRFYISRDSATRIIRRHFTTSIICTDPGARLYLTAE